MSDSSCPSSGLFSPWLNVPYKGIDDGKEPSSDGSDRNKLWLSWSTRRSRDALRLGLCRAATRAPMLRAERTAACPPVPPFSGWRVQGVRPTRTAICVCRICQVPVIPPSTSGRSGRRCLERILATRPFPTSWATGECFHRCPDQCRRAPSLAP